MEQEEFDGILMDCQMPVMDGYTATKKIRQKSKFEHIPVIAMTANVMAGDRERVVSAGMDDHIGKPINVKEMFTTMSKWITPKHPTTNSADKRTPTETVTEENIPDLPGVNIEKGLAVAQGNTKLYRKLLSKFADSQGTFEAQFLTALQSEESEAPTRCAHTLKGVAGNIGAEALQNRAKELEQVCLSKQKPEQLELLLNRTIQELTIVINGLTSFIGSVSSTETKNQIDYKLIPALLTQLRELLLDDDTDATEVIEELSTVLYGSPLIKALQPITKSIDDYDFDEGLAALDAFETKFSDFSQNIKIL